MAAAKHRAIDRLRRRKLIERKHAELGRELEVDGEGATPDLDAALDDDIGDDLLRLIFTACHPVLSTEARVALTLAADRRPDDRRDRPRLPGARADRGPAHRARQAHAGREARSLRGAARRRARRTARLGAGGDLPVFNEGYSATAGDDWMRPQLCEDALRLGRILAELAPEEPEVHGLVALMEIQASRLGARTGPSASRSCCSTRTARAGTSC